MRTLRWLALAVLLLAILLPPISVAVANTPACCTAGVCTEVFDPQCSAGGGMIVATGPGCAGIVCPVAVPSTGSSGVMILAVLLLAAATWLIVRRTRSAPEA